MSLDGAEGPNCGWECEIQELPLGLAFSQSQPQAGTVLEGDIAVAHWDTLSTLAGSAGVSEGASMSNLPVKDPQRGFGIRDFSHPIPSHLSRGDHSWHFP